MMHFSRLLALVGVIFFMAALAGCDKGNDSGTSPAHSSEDDHDHDHAHEGDADDHDHAHAGDADDHDHDHDHGEHDHGDSHELGSITIAGATMDVSMSGELTPNEEVHIDIVHTGGPLPAAVRLWIGVASGDGSLKSKADGHDNHFHGHAEVPTQMPDGAALWIEVESASGAPESGSLPLS